MGEKAELRAHIDALLDETRELSALLEQTDQANLEHAARAEEAEFALYLAGLVAEERTAIIERLREENTGLPRALDLARADAAQWESAYRRLVNTQATRINDLESESDEVWAELSDFYTDPEFLNDASTLDLARELSGTVFEQASGWADAADRASSWWESAKFYARYARALSHEWEQENYGVQRELDQLKSALRTLADD